ncbi:MAG: hypothetical protein JWO36_1943 [Myxococcales bacterium]|nr:hypothetical protein [Myxococcales bacterium]
MAGDDEAQVRATLIEMQQRISKGPYNALGVTNTATHEQVRSAFLQLTKRFHPARFARLSADLQKFSNEVFLGLRSAHDTLVNGSSLRSGASRSGAFPTVQAEGTGGTRSVTSAMPPIQRPPAPRAAGTMPASTRQPTPDPPIKPAAPPAPRTPPQQTLPQRTTQPIPRPPTVAAKPVLPARPTGAMDAINPPTLRYGEQHKAPGQAFDERGALEHAVELITAKNWLGARQALHALAARVPQSKQYRALLCYTRGREAQIANRGDEATLEFQRALQLDPDLAAAKEALAEIQRRR